MDEEKKSWDLVYPRAAPVKSSDFWGVLMAAPNQRIVDDYPIDLREAVTDAISALDDRDQYLIEAIYIWGESYNNIAKHLGYASKASAYKAVKRAEKNLRAILVNDIRIQNMLGDTDE